jgi:adenylyltransferase/sulfurtransferase
VTTAIKILLGRPVSEIAQLITLDLWTNYFKTIEAGSRRPNCPACGQNRFEFLDRPSAGLAATLCGRGAVQIRPTHETTMDLIAIEHKLAPAGPAHRTPYFLRFTPADSKLSLTLFPDGRALIHGTSDTGVARSLYARYVGS